MKENINEDKILYSLEKEKQRRIDYAEEVCRPGHCIKTLDSIYWTKQKIQYIIEKIDDRNKYTKKVEDFIKDIEIDIEYIFNNKM